AGVVATAGGGSGARAKGAVGKGATGLGSAGAGLSNTEFQLAASRRFLPGGDSFVSREQPPTRRTQACSMDASSRCRPTRGASARPRPNTGKATGLPPDNGSP